MTRLTDLPCRRSLLNGFTLCAAGILLVVFGMAGGSRAADEPTDTLTMLTVERARELAATKGDRSKKGIVLPENLKRGK